MDLPANQPPPVAGQPTADRGGVLVLNRDLFFGVRIGQALRALGYRVAFARNSTAFVARLAETGPPPVLAIVDLAAEPDWPAIGAVLAAQSLPVPVLAFGPHVAVEALRAAKAAGATRVVSNGELHRALPALVTRYARPAAPAANAAPEG